MTADPKPLREITEEEIGFLEGILERNHGYANQLDTYASIMIALSSAILIFSFSQLHTGPDLFWVVLGLTSGAATILSLLIIRPPKALRKQGQTESIMYSRKIIDYQSPEKYREQLEQALHSRETMLAEYSKEIYNLTKYYYLPKKLLFRIAKGILTIGVSISLLLFLLEYF